MGNKDSRAGGKFTGNHTTLSPLAALLCDIASACRYVTKISPGFLKAGLPAVNGQRRVKLSQTPGGGGILLSVRDNVSHQEVHVYSTKDAAAMFEIARGCRNANVRISFGNSKRNKEEGK